VNAVDDGISQLDPAGRFVAVTEAITDATGYDRDAVPGSHVPTVLDESAVERIEGTIRAMLASGLDTATVDLPVETADGEVIETELQLSVLRSDGVFAGTVGVVRQVRAAQNKIFDPSSGTTPGSERQRRHGEVESRAFTRSRSPRPSPGLS
jgi:PAS domain S-box-containing protein